MQRRPPSALAGALAAALLGAIAASASSPPPDWNALADVGTIRISAPEADGTPRERTIWLVVVDGSAYIRAGGTSSWDDAIDTDPDVTVHVNDVAYDLRATRIPEGELTERVHRAFREKYGLSDALIGLVRGIGGTPRILRLDPRPGLPMR
ncbi:MAG: hypothetical protein DCC71_06490 [Proteobacteria bacterium]|nr:MAG: hypothetical protein DCC71_06490 [Pseudomonadota bacterium]